jgi:thymidylate synthase
MIAQVCGLGVGDFVWARGDTYLYANHFEQAKLQLSREPMVLCQLKLNPEIQDIFDFKFEYIKMVGYESHPAIKAPVAV